MDEKTFLLKMKEDILNTEVDIHMDTALESITEWDSLSFVSFMAMASINSDKAIDHQAVKQSKTLRDLFNFL